MPQANSPERFSSSHLQLISMCHALLLRCSCSYSCCRCAPKQLRLFTTKSSASSLALHLSRLLRTPNTLQEPIPLRQSVDAVVSLSPRSDESTQRICLVLACIPAVLVNFANADLHAGVVFGFDDSVCGGAFAGHVTGEWLVCLMMKRYLERRGDEGH